MNDKLTNHLLACIAEEAGEITQAACKGLRFGLDRVEPSTNSSNFAKLITEANDLIAVIEMFVSYDVGVEFIPDREAIEAKKLKVMKYYNKFNQSDYKEVLPRPANF